MQNIYGKVYQALTKENTQLSKMVVEMLDSGYYNLATIQENDGIFHFEFTVKGLVLPDMIYEYLTVFIEKKSTL